MNVVLGFDPGGEGNFGLAVCIDQDIKGDLSNYNSELLGA